MHLYTGKFDLTFTAFQIPFLGICFGLFTADAWRNAPWTNNTAIVALGILGVVSLGFSYTFALRSNRNARLALLVFPLKYLYATAMIGLGFTALLLGLFTLPYRGKPEYLRDEARDIFWHFTKSSGFAATLLRSLGRWNRKLIRPMDVSGEFGQPVDVNQIGSNKL